MPNLKRTARTLGQRLQAKTKRGILGREDGSIRAPNGRYYVREYLSDNRLAPAVALPLAKNAQVPVRYNVAVILGYDATGQRVILSFDQQAAATQGVPPSSTNLADPQNQRVYKEQILPLRCRKSQTPGKVLYAEVLPDRFVIGDTYYDWPGGDIDLSGEIPSSGNHCYTVVFWRESTNDLEIASSTPQATGTPLDDTDVQEAIDAANTDTIPVKAYVMTADMTSIFDTADSCIDIRTLFNRSSGGSSAAYYQTLRDDGTDKVQRGKANFVDGNGIDIVLSDDAGNDETEITITVNQSELTTLVPKSLFDANTVLKADSDDTPIALTMGASTILARLAAGNIVAATVAQIKTLLAYVFSDIGGTAATTQGGTGLTSYSQGDILYASAANTLSALAKGTTGFVLKATATIVAWEQLFYQTIKKAGSAVTQRSNTNFIDGSGVSVTVADNAGTDATDITPGLAINGLTEDTAPDGDADFVATYDTSASTHKKVKLGNVSNRFNIQEFLADGTWNKPDNCTMALVYAVGGGGGGGGGAMGAVNRAGGAAGGGGGRDVKLFRLSELPSSISVSIGDGGTGGNGASAVGSGSDGNDGGRTQLVGLRVTAAGGAGGAGGTATTGATAGGGGGGNVDNATDVNGGKPRANTTDLNAIGHGGANGGTGTVGGAAEFGGGGGGSSVSTSASFAGGTSMHGGGGGGGGGSYATGTSRAPANGGLSGSHVYGSDGGGAAGTNGAAPTAGTDGADATLLSSVAGSGGGGGGGTNTSGVSGARGGHGGYPGGGGGGGGCSLNATGGATAGSGGNGADGYLAFICW